MGGAGGVAAPGPHGDAGLGAAGRPAGDFALQNYICGEKWFIFALKSALSTSLLHWRLYLAESSLSLSMKGSWARTLDPELEHE